MKITYSPHAKKRLAERSILKSAVVLTIAEPDKVINTGRNRVIANKRFKDYTLEVVYVSEGNRIIIITVYFL